jgi:TctA family transporter
MLATILVQPLTGDDVVKILTVLFAGVIGIVYAWRGPAAAGKPDLTAILAGMHTAMNQLLLNAQPGTTTTTTETQGDPVVKQTVTTSTQTANPALVDTLPLDGQPLPKPAK